MEVPPAQQLEVCGLPNLWLQPKTRGQPLELQAAREERTGVLLNSKVHRCAQQPISKEMKHRAMEECLVLQLLVHMLV